MALLALITTSLNTASGRYQAGYEIPHQSRYRRGVREGRQGGEEACRLVHQRRTGAGAEQDQQPDHSRRVWRRHCQLVGKIIIVFPMMTDVRGKMTPALRVRIPPPKQATSAPQQQAAPQAAPQR